MATIQQLEGRFKAQNSFVGVEGLDEIARGLREVGRHAQSELREVYKSGGDMIVRSARPDIPVLSGRLVGSLKSAPTAREGRVRMGTATRVPYAGWVEFGGTILFPNRTARSGGSARKTRVRIRERSQVLGGFVSLSRRVTQVVGTGAVTASREFIGEGRYLYPAYVAALGPIRQAMTSQIETLARRYDVGP